MKKAVVFVIVMVAVYLLAFPTRLKPELHFSPGWASELGTKTDPPRGERPNRIHFFNLDEAFGYITDGGDVLYLDRKMYGVAIDSRRFVNYSSVSGNLVVQGSSGEVLDAIEIRGYPLLLDDRIFIISTNRGEFGEIDIQGTYIWKYEYSSPITDLDAQNGRVLLGLLDGRVYLYKTDGSREVEISFQRSRVNAVYGCALSADGTRFSVVHGIDPQILSVFELNPEPKLIFEAELADTFRRRRVVDFISQGEYVVVDGQDGVYIMDLDRGELFDIIISGRLVGGFSDVSDPLAFILTHDGKTANLLTVALPPAELARSSYPASQTVLINGENYIILGIDRYLGRIDRMVR